MQTEKEQKVLDITNLMAFSKKKKKKFNGKVT
jgi:hypothetical protein